MTEFREVAKDVEPALRCLRGFHGLKVTFRVGRFECRVVRRRDIVSKYESLCSEHELQRPVSIVID